MFNKFILKLMFAWLMLFTTIYAQALDHLQIDDATRITTYTGHFYFFRIDNDLDPYGAATMSYILASSIIKEDIFNDGFEVNTERLPLPLWPYQITLMNVTSESHSSDCYALVHYQAGAPPTGDLDVKLVCPNSTYILPLE